MRSSNLNSITLILAFFLTSCDSGEFSDPPLKYQGYFAFIQSESEFQVHANFIKQTIDTPVSVFQKNWIEMVDYCEVTALDPNAVPEQRGQDSEDQPDLVSAGETITITSEFGTFATLNRSTGDSPSYSTEMSQTTAPANLSFDIPGDVFPTFSNVAIPQADPVDFIQNVEENGVTPTTEFEWVTDNNPLSTISFSAFDYEPMTGIGLHVGCKLVDDGYFSFPEDIQLQMSDGFTSIDLFVSRRVASFVQNGNALLVITTDSSMHSNLRE